MSKSHMGKQESKTSALRPAKDGGITMRGNRYYVQHLTEYIFLIRERMTGDGEPGLNDRIVRSFADRNDAYKTVSEMNERQRQLNEHNEAENDAQIFVGDDGGDLFRESGQRERGKE